MGQYRDLLRVPTIGRFILSMQLSRIAQQMVPISLVLLVLHEYQSAQLAGFVTFAAVFPGLVFSPIAGALLDRYGRSRLVVFDYVVAAIAVASIAALSWLRLLTPVLLVTIATCASLTGILSLSGLRSLFPLLVPRQLWERANAIDANGYVVATLVGPPLAGGLAQVWGASTALVAIALTFGLAAAFLVRFPEPIAAVHTSKGLLRDAWLGLKYTFQNPTLRGLVYSIFTMNLGWGIATVAIPVLVLSRLHQGPLIVGIVYAALAITGGASALVAGRINSEGRERVSLAIACAGLSIAFIIFALANSLAMAVAGAAVAGVVIGPMDVVIFSVRQRRTDSAWLGRAFAVSIACNYSGMPIGALAAGPLIGWSLAPTFLVGAGACLLAAALAWLTIPQHPGLGGSTNDVVPCSPPPAS